VSFRHCHEEKIIKYIDLIHF